MRRSITCLAFMVAGMAGTLVAHPGEAHAAPPPTSWAWSWDPWAMIPLAMSALAYSVGLWRFRNSDAACRVVPRWSVASFWAGWLTLAAALLSPIDTISDVLFSVHMTQHMLLMLVAAPLLVFGLPFVVGLWSLPRAWRHGLMRRPAAVSLRPAWRLLTAPVVVWALHALALWLWHAPAFFDATLRNDGIHAFQHACFLGTACLFWWSLVQGRYGRLGYGAAVVYVFTTAVHSTLLGALLTLAPQPWYSTYVLREGPGALADQQIAGLLMWVPAGVIFMLLGLGLFAAWLGEANRRASLAADGGPQVSA